MVGLADSSLDQVCAMDGLAVDIRVGVVRVLQDLDHATVADRGSLEVNAGLPIRGAREVHPLGEDRQQHLTGAAELAELRGDEPYRFLNV